MNGFENETEICSSLNNKDFIDLNKNLQNLLLKIHGIPPESKIECFKIGGEVKTDLSIKLDGITYNLSIKKGTGNSVHQEPVDEFIKYLGDHFEHDDEVFNNIRHFIWGDKTLNGSGEINDRLSANKYSKEHPEKIKSIQEYLNKHLKELLIRFVITGVKSTSKIDYLYYGTTQSGKCVSSEELLDFLIKNRSNGSLSIGKLTFQAWNRNINGGDKSEHKRGQIQLKWGSLKDDISII